MNFTKKLLFVALVATTLLACQKDEVQIPIQSNDDQSNSSIQFRSSKETSLDKELIDQWINWNNIQYDYNFFGKGILEKEYGKLALGFVYKYENSNAKYTAIPFVSPNNTVKAVALTQLKGGVTSFFLYRGNTDISNNFNVSSQGGSGVTVAGIFGDLDPECDGDGDTGSGNWLSGLGGACGGGPDDPWAQFEGAENLPEIGTWEACPNEYPFLFCQHPRSGVSDDDGGTNSNTDTPPEIGDGTPVVITFPTNPNGTSIPFFPSGGGSGGSVTLIFTREELKSIVEDFNDEHGVSLTYRQLLRLNPGCLLFASISTSLNATVGAKELERCMEEAYIKTLFKDCTSDISSEASEYLQELIFDSEISDPCDASKSHHDIIDELRDDICAGNPSTVGIEEILDAFAEDDHIINGLTDERLLCIYKSLSEGTDEIFCSTYENFVGETEINLNLQNSHLVPAIAITTPYFLTPNSPYGNIIDIAFNENQLEDLCEVSVVAVFLHEGIHAEMDKLLNDPNIDSEDFKTIWETYDERISEHDNMAISYIDNLINALKQRFGNRYSDNQYEAIAWIGLGDINGEGVNTSAWINLSESKKLDLKEIFANVNNNCDNDECS